MTWAIRRDQRRSEAIRGHQRPSEAIGGHQRPSEVISPPAGDQTRSACLNLGEQSHRLVPERSSVRRGLWASSAVMTCGAIRRSQTKSDAVKHSQAQSDAIHESNPSRDCYALMREAISMQSRSPLPRPPSRDCYALMSSSSSRQGPAGPVAAPSRTRAQAGCAIGRETLA